MFGFEIFQLLFFLFIHRYIDHYHHFILTLLPLIILFIWINSSLIDCQAYNGPISRQVEVFVNVYDHPKTGFSCQGKNPGQYYADPATKCAVYYVCIPNPTGTMSAQSFACPNGTIFSQATRVCRPHEEGMHLFFYLYLFIINAMNNEFVFLRILIRFLI